MPFVIGVNRFSLHAMYRNRLIRGYLGASKRWRKANPFTGFDHNDNVWMHELRFVPESAIPRVDLIALAISGQEQIKNLLSFDAISLVDDRVSRLSKILAALAKPPDEAVKRVANMLDAQTLQFLQSSDLSRKDVLELAPHLTKLRSYRYWVAVDRILGPSLEAAPRAELPVINEWIGSLTQALKESLNVFRVATSQATDTVGWTRQRQAEFRRVVARDFDRLLRNDPARIIHALDGKPPDTLAELREQATKLLNERLNFEVDSGRFARPLHIVNMTLNLVGGAQLQWQERKGENFTVSALHSGSPRTGYRDSERYGGDARISHANPDYSVDRGISLGTAIAISGAAASPNMGYISSPVITLLMTLFNVRLGWWLGNPGERGKDTYYRSEPRYGLRGWLSEAFGRTNDKSSYVYLSDGGHFENLGLYEMVRRRCHLIVVCDAAADPDYSFGDLGNAIQKIRVDQGIEISFDDFPIFKYENNKAARRGKVCALGRIDYRAADGGKVENGWLIYIKPTLCGDETADVLNYWRQHMSFPQQSTVNQWFDENEFESYRALGFATMRRIILDNNGGWKINSVYELKNRAEAYLKGAPAAPAPAMP